MRIEVPDEFVEAIARRAAELLLERTGAGEISSPAPWMTVEEAAVFLRCAPARIYNLRSDGRLGKYTEGGRALVKREELEGLIANERELSPAERVRRVA